MINNRFVAHFHLNYQGKQGVLKKKAIDRASTWALNIFDNIG